MIISCCKTIEYTKYVMYTLMFLLFTTFLNAAYISEVVMDVVN